MKYRLTCILAVTVLLGACKYSDKFRVMDTAHFVVEMPPYLNKANNLHPEAQVQGRNNYRDVYFMVLEHERSASDSAFSARFDTITAGIKNYCRDPYVEMDSTFTVNGLQGKYRRVTGSIKDKRLVFTIALIRGKNQDYEISGWLFTGKRGLWLKDLHQGISSFKEK